MHLISPVCGLIRKGSLAESESGKGSEFSFKRDREEWKGWRSGLLAWGNPPDIQIQM